MEDDLTTPEEEQLLKLLRTANPKWQRQFAKRLAGPTNPSPGQLWFFRPRYVAAWASLIIASLAILVAVFARRQPNIDRLLAQAYTERRVLEIRFPGAEYSPLAAQQRGSGNSRFERPALLRAELEISHHDVGIDAPWLQARAKAELLEWKPDLALADLQLVQLNQQRRNDPSVMLDLAAALYEQAKLYGHSAYYGQAIETLSAILQKNPSNLPALFNRAINFEALAMYSSAAADWQAYLKLDASGRWSDEARQHLANMEQLISRPQSQSNHSPEPKASPPETQLGAAVFSFAAPSCKTGIAPPVNQAAVAAALATDFGDHWLEDFSRESRPSQAVCQLVMAMKANQSGQPEAAIRAAREAQQLFKQSHASAGAARASLELVFGLHRMPKPRECFLDARSLSASPGIGRYPWIQIQNLLEISNCESMLGQLAAGREDLEKASQLAHKLGFYVAELRATGLIAEYEAVSGNAPGAWEATVRGLQLFWSGQYPPARAYQLYAGLAYLTEKQRLWALSAALNREGLRFISLTENASTEAMAQYRLATDELMARELDSAWRDFELAENRFARLPQTASWQAYRSYGEVVRAGLEANSGTVQQAIARLSRSEGTLLSTHDSIVGLLAYRAESQVALASHDAARAKSALEKMARVALQAHESVSSQEERYGWEWQVKDAYRELCGFYLVEGKDELRALRVWEEYRGLAVSQFNSLQAAKATGEKSLPQLSGRSVLSYVVFNDSLEIFLFDNRGFWAQSVRISEADLATAVAQLRSLCSSPDSNQQLLHRSAQRMYSLVILPIQEHLSAQRLLDIQADGPLRSLPFSVLESSDGKRIQSTGLDWLIGSAEESRNDKIDMRSAKALVVAGIPGDPESELRPSRDAELEARSVAAYFPNSAIAQGPSLSWRDLADRLGNSDVFHFSGHATIHADSPVLLIGSGSGNRLGSEQAAAMQKGKFEKCRLVYLAACSTQAGTADSVYQDLVAALLRGGVSFVVASQWDLDSAAARTMAEEFYKKLGEGSPVPVALHEAQQKVAQSTRWSHPYYWAGVVVNARN